MSTFVLNAEIREDTGKEKMKKLRAKGHCPAVIYGSEQEPVSLTINIRDTEVLLQRIHGEKILVEVKYGDKTDKAFVRQVDRDPVKNLLEHIDFYRVDPDHEIDTTVPVLSVGTPIGVKMGGIMEPGLRKIDLRALPANVPPHIDVNVEKLNIGQSIHVSDLDLPNVKLLTAGDGVLFAIHGREKEDEPTEGAEAAAS